MTVTGKPSESRAGDGAPCPDQPVIEVLPSRETDVAGVPVRRALPKRTRRLVGSWCFADHFGPTDADDVGMSVGPHPHIGIHTVTWLVDGEVLHRDSLGSEQLIRPGQLNLMTAGRGIAHAEVSTKGSSKLHGAQLWIAQPERTRNDAPAFEHHGALPMAAAGSFDVTVLVGDMLGAVSGARADTPLVGADIAGHIGVGELPLRREFEYAVIALVGEIDVDGTPAMPGSLVYLGRGRDHLDLRCAAPSRALLLGGEPLGEDVLMWWNFVARTRDEISAARADWQSSGARFGDVRSELARIAAPEN